ncbi:response regulator transcription factor [Clostridium magnum]|uniref:Stage 0 sporulation protein A homolog n=1 Tax=Clostridium magnum DSM 2767 TaxID=1121326 RepID=A0A162QEQ4_9CLOT|nr:response regulator transcription factor [Clostridium magnum]KZL88454.1 transcriptional regulatory protein SrrA [Clostridium magnum DSM 2767]SHI90810.1 DNA-binding response regulator, OmpR family, contains REC and winged-helix (wHTH) domain [Clostridium magnum DSM 2767]
MSRNILLVEDDERIREIVADYFIKEDFHIFEAEDGRQAMDIFEKEEINLIILDIMIPKLDGWSVCKRLRKISDVPIIMLTARSDEEDKLMGYDLGSDDYVTKPFSPRVLVAKSKMLLKRTEGSVGKADGILTYNGIEINRLSRTVKIDERSVDFSTKEFELMFYMMENKDIVLSREVILSKVWGYDYYGDLRTVDTHIKKLRSKLGEKAICISTIIGAGYKFEVSK